VERLPAMNEITLRNRQLGPEIAMQIVEDRAPDGFATIDDIVSREELESFSRSFNQIAGFDRRQVNEQPSILHDFVTARRR
jgi:5-methylphenazine-1-carboxylate 1-monooxygenase